MEPSGEMIEAVLFDLDDTLTNRSATLSRYVGEFAADFKSQLPDVQTPQIETLYVSLDDRGYRPRQELFEGVLEKLPWVSRPNVSAIEDHWFRCFPALTVPQADMHLTLSRLKAAGLRLGVVTNGTVSTQTAKIEQLRLKNLLDSLVISEAAGYWKPQPEIFRKALVELGTNPDKTVFVWRPSGE